MIFIDTGAFLARYIEQLLQKYADQGVSFTDCVSFVLMQKGDIRRVFSFDRHFRIAGFEVEP